VTKCLSHILLAALSLTALSACATQDELAHGDPLERVNRPIHGFNRAVETRVIAPIADRVDDTVETADGGDGRNADRAVLHAKNVFSNLGEPSNAINATLQGKPGSAGTALGRFAINSTMGVLGLFDVADAMHIHERREDFGQTLGEWGAPPGPYVVAPLGGESTARDMAGGVVDGVINPVRLPAALGLVKRGVRAADTMEDAQDEAEAPESEDRYAEERRTYKARREAQIADADGHIHEPREVIVEHRYAPKVPR